MSVAILCQFRFSQLKLYWIYMCVLFFAEFWKEEIIEELFRLPLRKFIACSDRQTVAEQHFLNFFDPKHSWHKALVKCKIWHIIIRHHLNSPKLHKTRLLKIYIYMQYTDSDKCENQDFLAYNNTKTFQQWKVLLGQHGIKKQEQRS